MNQSNPIIDVKDEKRAEELQREKTRTYYPIKVCCVVWDLTDANGDKVIKMIKDHTHKSNAHFMTRVYDSTKYTDDCYQITRLPAFHVYIKGAYNRTFYTNTRPLQHIDECIESYIQRVESKKMKKKRWTTLYASFVAWIKKMAHRETRMERYQREETDLNELNNSKKAKSFESRMEHSVITLSEWN